MITREEVLKIARLACLELSDDEASAMTSELGAILEYVKQLERYDLAEVEPMSHVHGSVNVFRDDQLRPSLEFDQAFKNAPDLAGRFIRVPIIFDTDQTDEP